MKLKCILKEEVHFLISIFVVDANDNKTDNGGADNSRSKILFICFFTK